MRKIYFIINPKARDGYCLKIWQSIELKLKEMGLHYFALFTEYPGHAQKLSAQIAMKSREVNIIIAVGGDGTLHEVMNGIINNNDITLGFIPGGSGNDFSRGFQIPADPIEALQVIYRLMKNDSPFIDTGKITLNSHEEHYFVNNMGAGFDALISYEVNQSNMKSLLNKLSLGRLVYAFILLKKLFTYDCSTISLMIDGKKHIFEQTWFVTVSNQPFYGGGMKISPSAIPDDGLLDVTVVHLLSKIKLLFVFLSVFWGKHTHFKEVKMFKGRAISIHSSSKLFVHADGEFIGHTPLTIQVQPNSLRVLTRRQGKREIELKREEFE
ncbi:diacylglycerol kinase family lipid kinase [Neobacillus sp. PS3-40]|uniref:diacylglycerol/lipid kinase family protein n=1 Tax=Neobacillus sp. PS3-40 TaxID=3070679 RepID=UPI0027E203CA|nr:diacylglycerol kinase family lipid kinase [Neobacillus sp. PS3-40]WML45697.1 diacylglycerol kinase family lipid kinase [Neobacillus sp. PS3-40]